MQINLDPALYISVLIQTLVYLLIAPGVSGTLIWMKARLQGRQGPAPIQPYRNLLKLFRRSPVIPQAASWVFWVAPGAVFGCHLILGVLLPVFWLPDQSTINQAGGPPLADLLVLVYLLGLSRFLISLAGIDSGAPFTALGSGREMFIHFLVEPSLILAIYTLSLNAHSTSLLRIILFHRDLSPQMLLLNPANWLVFLALLLVMLAETARIPFDNPATHLELTMVGKAIELEYGGPHLALLEWASALRLTFFITLLINLALPWTLAISGQPLVLVGFLALLYPVKLLAVLFGLAVWEMSRAKLRLRAVTGPAGLALAFSILSVVIMVIVKYSVR